MESSLSHISQGHIPQHIAIIMDGNGRWAKHQSMPRIFGHKNGVKAVREVTEAAAELGVKYLTLYAFSKENWKRPAIEVETLMKLFVTTVSKELKTLNENNIPLAAIGDLEALPADTLKALKKAIDETKDNSHMTLVLALNYSARWEILQAVKGVTTSVMNGEKKLENLSEEDIASHLTTKDIPDPELLIRTSGESRISNFLLWQISYAELLFTDTLWPDFRKADLYRAIREFQHRERRFGMTSEQIIKS